MVQTQGLKTLVDIGGFLAGSQAVEIKTPQREVAYAFIAETLRRLGYARLGRAEKGLLRVDSVHQGDLDGVKGLYHINLVDEVTQFQFVGSVERISEHFLLPVLAALLDAFPFVILGFHSDNGSKYINTRVAALLAKLHAEFYPSRARAAATTKVDPMSRTVWPRV